MEQFYQLEI